LLTSAAAQILGSLLRPDSFWDFGALYARLLTY